MNCYILKHHLPHAEVWSAPGEAVLALKKQPGCCCMVILALVCGGARLDLPGMLMQRPACLVSLVGRES